MTTFDHSSSDNIYKFIFYIVFLVNLFWGISSNETICDRKCSVSMNSSIVASQCNADIVGRCCINETDNSILGLDLGGCNIKALDGVLANLTNVTILVLDHNPLEPIKQHDFYGLAKLEYLSLPPHFSCPGNASAWENVNMTVNGTQCGDELNMCSAYNMSCPPNSYCLDTGPGLTECLCSPHYYGYKCLRTGIFPEYTFWFSMGGSTLVLSVSLWIVTRRNVKS